MGKNKRKSNKHSKSSTALEKTKKGNKSVKAKRKDTKMKLKYKHPKLALALKIILIALVIIVVVGSGVTIGLLYGLWGDDLKINLSELVLKPAFEPQPTKNVTSAKLSKLKLIIFFILSSFQF